MECRNACPPSTRPHGRFSELEWVEGPVSLDRALCHVDTAVTPKPRGVVRDLVDVGREQGRLLAVSAVDLVTPRVWVVDDAGFAKEGAVSAWAAAVFRNAGARSATARSQPAGKHAPPLAGRRPA